MLHHRCACFITRYAGDLDTYTSTLPPMPQCSSKLVEACHSHACRVLMGIHGGACKYKAHTHQHTREKRCKQTSLVGVRKLQDQQSPKHDLWARLTNHGGYECATGACVVRPNKRMKPQVQTTLRSPNDIMAHSGSDAAIAVWQVHVSQCEFEHLLEFLSVTPMPQLHHVW